MTVKACVTSPMLIPTLTVHITARLCSRHYNRTLGTINTPLPYAFTALRQSHVFLCSEHVT